MPRALRFVRVLEEFDGDILTEYRATNGGGFYLEKWCSRHQQTNRYLIVRTEQRAIAEYLGGRISMLQLLTYSSDGGGFIVDRTDGARDIVYSVRLEELPATYMPSAIALHDETLRPNWAVVPQDFLIDTDWDAKLLASIERRYLDVFGFGFFTEPGKGRKLPASVFNYDYDGGFPIMHVYNKIRTLVPQLERAKSVGVAAASPGVLTIDAPAATVKHLSKSFESLTRAENSYEQLHSWSRLSPARIELLPTTALADIQDLARILEVDSAALFPNPTDEIQNPNQHSRFVLAAGKLLAAHYRKMWKLLEPERGVEFISVKIDNMTVPPVSVFDDEDDE